MFELDIEMLKEQGLQLVDSAKKTAQDLADKGKNKLDLLNQQARLSKAQRQLGALVYSPVSYTHLRWPGRAGRTVVRIARTPGLPPVGAAGYATAFCRYNATKSSLCRDGSASTQNRLPAVRCRLFQHRGKTAARCVRPHSPLRGRVK